MTRTCAAVGALLVPLFLASCQHIPREPLHLDDLREELRSRPLDIEPLRAYAGKIQRPISMDTSEFDVDDGLSLTEAESIALWYNTTARRARQAVMHAQGALESSGHWPDPEVALGLGEKETDGPGGMDRQWISNGGLSLTIPLSGRYRAQRQLAEQVYEVALRTAEEAEWQALTDIRLAWMTWSAAEARLALLDQYLRSLQPFRNVAGSLIATGEISAASAQLLIVEYERAAARKLGLLGESEAARLTVMEVMGLAPDAPVELQPVLATNIYASALDDGADITGEHPTLARLCAAYEEAERNLRLELKKQYPDITFSPLYTDESDETSLVVGMSAPVPVWNANRAGIAEAVANRDQARFDVEQAYQRLLVMLQQNRALLKNARDAWTHLSENVVNVQDAQLEQVLALQRAGELDLWLLYDVLRQFHDTRNQLLDIQVNICTAGIRFHAATAKYTGPSSVAKDNQP